MSKSISDLINDVEKADSSIKLLVAVSSLSKACSHESIPTLISVLSYNNPGAAVAAVNGLVKIGKESVPALMEEINNQNYTAKAWAIRALAGIGDPRSVDVLLEAATKDFSPSVRRTAAKGLGEVQWPIKPDNALDPRVLEVLETLLSISEKDEEWAVRYSAIVGLQLQYKLMTDENEQLKFKIKSHVRSIESKDPDFAVSARACLAFLEFSNMDIDP